ncbi:XkdW family protein [Brassicibacter mesophilus]|uniref:XkdW family protein n=1 Tax=Brassicibacter mesophilus TaxID=745119 RepID=UPI003D25C8F4
MLNIRIKSDRLITTAEYPSVPSKINETDIILLEVESIELENAILDSSIDVKILNVDTLEFETMARTVDPVEPSELELLGQEVTMLKLSNIQKDNTINVLGKELANIKLQLLQGGM